MKLRNKKTGEIEDWSFIVFKDISPNSKREHCFASISQLNEEWEDYKPTEPLIEDEKVRKAVRAWMRMLGADKARVCYHSDFVQPYTTIYARDGLDEYRLEVPTNIGAKNISYTITELCGEEEA